MYDVDEEHMRFMNTALGTTDGTHACVRDWVMSWNDVDSYLVRNGRERLGELARSTTSFLADPYRKWFLSAVDVAALRVGGGRA